MYNRTDPQVWRWRASRQLRWAYLALQGVCLTLSVAVPWPWWAKLALSIACLAHWAWVWPSLTGRPRHPWQALRHDANGWALQNTQGDWHSLRFLPSTRAMRGLIVLHFKVDGLRFAQSLCLPSDSMDAVAHRRLRVRLRFSELTRQTAGDTTQCPESLG